MSKTASIISFNLPLDVKESDDIIESLEFKNEEERIICEDIIKSLEKNIANYIRNDRRVYAPFMGVFSVNKYNLAHRNIGRDLKAICKAEGYAGKLKLNFAVVKRVKTIMNDADDNERMIHKVKKRNSKFYIKYAKMYGVEASKAMLGVIGRLTPINFDEELEEQLQILYNDERVA